MYKIRRRGRERGRNEGGEKGDEAVREEREARDKGGICKGLGVRNREGEGEREGARWKREGDEETREERNEGGRETM